MREQGFAGRMACESPILIYLFRMIRKPTLNLPHSTYYLRLQGAGHQALCYDAQERRDLLVFLERALFQSDTRLLAYCILPQELHLVVRTGSSPVQGFLDTLGTEMKAYWQAERKEGLFFRNVHQLWLDADLYLAAIIRHVHRLPEEVDCLQHWERYEGSSHNAYMSASSQSLVDCMPLLTQLGNGRQNTVQAYLEAMESPSRQQLNLEQGNHERFRALVSDDDIAADPRTLGQPAPLSDLAMRRMIRLVCDTYHCSENELRHDKNQREARAVLMWLTRESHDLTLDDLAHTLELKERELRACLRILEEKPRYEMQHWLSRLTEKEKRSALH